MALVIGVVAGLCVPMQSLTVELAARGGPTVLDMGVAFLSGMAAAHCVSRLNLSAALAGVTISAALVPPLATTGISLAMGEAVNARGAATLFATNVVSIILGAAVTFYAAGIRGQRTQSRGRRWVLTTVMALLFTTVIIAVPLTSVLATITDYDPSSFRYAVTREKSPNRLP